jgi:protein disulfide-isomerase A1
MNFVWIDAVKFGDHAKALNLGEAKWPAFVVQDLQKQLKYPLDQSKDFSAEDAGEWVEKYLLGELQPQLKSQPIPDTQDESVYTLVGKNFDDVVFDDAKDVFVEFYASWCDLTFLICPHSHLFILCRCGHCKRLKPIWDSIGDKYSAIKDRIVM